MATDTTDYRDGAKEKAADAVRELIDEVVDALFDDGEASDDINNDYEWAGYGGDVYAHENWTDIEYDLPEAAALLDQLDEFEETDSGLWEGQGVREAVSTCAAYTFAAACYHYFRDLIGEVNGDGDLDELLSAHRDGANDDAADSVVDALKRRVRARVKAIADEYHK